MENNEKTELIRKNGMEGKKQSEQAKNKISVKQKLRHAMYKSALKECALRKLKLTPKDNAPSNMEDEFLDARLRTFDNFMLLMNSFNEMKEIEHAMFQPDRTPSYKDMDNVEEDGIDENSLQENIKRIVSENVNNFIKKECNGKDK